MPLVQQCVNDLRSTPPFRFAVSGTTNAAQTRASDRLLAGAESRIVFTENKLSDPSSRDTMEAATMRNSLVRLAAAVNSGYVGTLLSRAALLVGLALVATAAIPLRMASAAPLTLMANGIAPAVARNSDGRLEVFVLESTSHIWHKWQTCAGCSWSSWSDLGGSYGDPMVAANADGRLEVFATSNSDGYAWHRWETTAGCSTCWSGWTRLGNRTMQGVYAAGLGSGGRLEIFQQTASGMYTAWETCSSCSSSWTSWSNLGGIFLSGTPAVGVNSGSRLEVFADYSTSSGGASGIAHAWQTCAGCGWTGWYGLNLVVDANPAVGQNADGRLELFVKDTNGSQQHLWQTSAACSTCLSGWNNLGGGFSLSTYDGNPTVGMGSSSRLEIFARGPNGDIKTDWQNCAGGTYAGCGWHGWVSLGGSLIGPAGVGQDTDGRMEILAKGSGGDLRLNYQTCSGCGWSGWSSLGG